jgi:prepilin-type N-terminal cleavage/methylation domain-containing protein
MFQTARGFSLVEALVAMAVFSVGLTALMPLAISQVRGNDEASVRSEAVALAQEKLEELRALPYATLHSLIPGADSVPPLHERAWGFLPATVLPGDEQDLKRVYVTVTWNLRQGGSRSVTLVTSKAKY